VSSAVLLDRFPKLVLDITCSVLEKDGSVASALINATTLALIDAGIEMNDMVSSCSVALLPGIAGEPQSAVIDPSANEEKRQWGYATVAVAPIRGNVTYVETSGAWDDVRWNEALNMAIVGCAQYDCTMRAWLKSTV
jgi:ribonuclease PH